MCIDRYEIDARRHAERRRWLIGERSHHEITKNGGRDRGTLLQPAERSWIVEADEHTADEIGREADEPGIFGIVGGSRFSGQRFAHGPDRDSRAALYNAFEQRDGLIRGARIDDLIARVGQERLRLVAPAPVAAFAKPRIVAIDIATVPVLNTVDQGRVDLLSAVGEFRIAGGHPDERGVCGADRIG